MKTFLKILVLVGLLVIIINGISGNTFNSENYINNLVENLEPFPRFVNSDDIEFNDYPDEFELDTFLIFFENAGKFFTLVYYILSYPIRIIIWIFKMLYILFSNLIIWG